MSRASSLWAFRKAVDLLRSLDPDLSLYVASDTLCLMSGPSHDDHGQARRDRILETTALLRISGGDW